MDLDLLQLYGLVVRRSLRRHPATAHVRVVVVLTADPSLLRDGVGAAAFAMPDKPADLDAVVRGVRAALRAP